ncbi:hypothetical protein PVAP13_9KG250300 [Panicum virgatum]|uniref:Uncharacterized protein n=1 Tax=Panicum virgatum TaxID=38727 RepID=A0A8T0NKQ3_PANVG|nr:hypothetical protein PVAP13_9KG250300 [Panicum virgatum]
MTGPSIDPATLSTISAKIDYALTQLSIINEKLDSHEERLTRLEKFQQAKKVGSLLRRATLAGGYIIVGAPSATPLSSTTSPAAAAVLAQFHTAAQFAALAAAAADIGGGALSVGVTASTLLVAAPTVISALAAGAATAPLAAKAEIAAAASASAASSAAVQRYVPLHRRAKGEAEASATASALAVPSSSSSVHHFSAADGQQGLGAILAPDVHARGGGGGYLMSCPEEQVRGVGLWCPVYKGGLNPRVRVIEEE